MDTPVSALSPPPTLTRPSAIRSQFDHVSTKTNAPAKMPWWGYLIAFLLLAIGISASYRIYTFFSQASTRSTKAGVIGTFVGATGDLIKKIFNTGALATETVATGGAEIVGSGVDSLDKISGYKSKVKTMNVDDLYLDTVGDEAEVEPDTAAPRSKGGYCFIGTANGIRSCARIGKDTKCMSGEIFPTHNLCVNPSLRV